MLKGLPIGVLLGALLAFALFRVVETRASAATSSTPAPAAGQADSAEADALKAEIASLGAEKSRLEADLAALDVKLAVAKGGKTAGLAKVKEGKKFENPWSPMAKKLFLLREKLDDIEKEDNEDYRDLMLQFVEIAKELTEERGFDLSEFESSPYGSPMLMLAVLEGGDPPVDPAVLERATNIVSKAEEDWNKSKEKKSEMLDLEWRLNGSRLVWQSMQDLKGVLTPEQRDWFKTGRMWSDDSVRVWASNISGTRDTVESQLLQDWNSSLQLGEGGDAPLRPLAGQFTRDYEAMEAGWKRREAAGEKLTDAEKALARAELAVALEKKIQETVNLTQEQAKRLKAMGHAWELTITQ